MDFARLVSLYGSLRSQAMDSPQEAIAANEALRDTRRSMTAVFTGATHGVGLGTLEAFVKHISKPRAIIIGRSRKQFAAKLQEIQALNASAELVFIEAQLTLIEEVDRVSKELQLQEPPQSIDLLCMSQGYAPIGQRKFTSEGLDEAMTLACYGRVRLAERLGEAGVMRLDARIVSVLAGGKEGKLFEDDLELKQNYSIMNLRGHFSLLTTLSFDILAERNSQMGFVHVYPGTVSTGLLTRGIEGSLPFRLLLGSLELLSSFFAMTTQVSGERTLWASTAMKFARGSFSIKYDGTLSESECLATYRQNSMKDTIWSHLESLFQRALSSGQAVTTNEADPV